MKAHLKTKLKARTKSFLGGHWTTRASLTLPVFYCLLIFGLNACNNNGDGGGGVKVKAGQKRDQQLQKTAATGEGNYSLSGTNDKSEKCSIERLFPSKAEACTFLQQENFNDNCAKKEREAKFKEFGCAGTFSSKNLSQSELDKAKKDQESRKTEADKAKEKAKEEANKTGTEEKAGENKDGKPDDKAKKTSEAFYSYALTTGSTSLEIIANLVDPVKKDQNKSEKSKYERNVRMGIICREGIASALEDLRKSDNKNGIAIISSSVLSLGRKKGSAADTTSSDLEKDSKADDTKSTAVIACEKTKELAEKRLTEKQLMSVRKQTGVSTANVDEDENKDLQVIALRKGQKVKDNLRIQEPEQGEDSLHAYILCASNDNDAAIAAGEKALALGVGSKILAARNGEAWYPKKVDGKEVKYKDAASPAKLFVLITCE